MSRFHPESYAEAAALRAEKPAKPRKPMSRGTKGLSRGSLRSGAPQNGRDENTPTALIRRGIGRKKPTGVPKKVKRKRLPSIKNLKKRVWAEFSIYIRTRDADEFGIVSCVTCPARYHWSSGQIHAGHWIHGRLDFDERNIHGQCRNDNFYSHTKVNTAYACFMAKTYGHEVMNELRLLSNTRSNKYSRDELNEMLVKLRNLNAINPLTQETP